MKKYLVLDIGGSAIKYAKMDEEATILEKGSVKTPLDKVESLIEVIGSLYDQYQDEVEGIAISMPGVLDVERGYAYSGGFLRYNTDVEIVKLIQERCPVKVTIENDGKCAALAEGWRGSLQDVNDAIVIVLGTGIGGGVVINRKVHKGSSSFAGEFSSMRLNNQKLDDGEYTWGFSGGARQLSSKVAEVKQLNPDEVDGYFIFEKANEGDEEVLAILDEFTKQIAAQIVNLQCVIDPQRVAIGGGISAQPLLLEYIRKNVDSFSDNFGNYKPGVQVVPCTFRNDSNLIGALYHYLTYTA